MKKTQHGKSGKQIFSMMSHAQVVCLALSLFLLRMHDVVITCNMRNAESSILHLALQVGCAEHATALGWKFGHYNRGFGLVWWGKQRKRRGQKKESQLAAISIDRDHPRGAQAALVWSYKGSQEFVTCFVRGIGHIGFCWQGRFASKSSWSADSTWGQWGHTGASGK